jgi:hypothetical protein
MLLICGSGVVCLQSCCLATAPFVGFTVLTLSKYATIDADYLPLEVNNLFKLFQFCNIL